MSCISCIAVNGTPSHSYGDGVLPYGTTQCYPPVTRYKWTHLALTPSSQAGTRFTYPGLPGGMEGEFAQRRSPIHTFPRNFPVDGEVANLLPTSRCNEIWETTRHTQRTQRTFARANLLQTCRYVADLLRGSPTCYGLVRGKWCIGLMVLALTQKCTAMEYCPTHYCWSRVRCLNHYITPPTPCL